MRSPLAPVFSVKRNPDRQALALVVIVVSLILSVTLLLPLGFDNDVYESMAWTLYAYHGLPYTASWDMNFPGIVFIHWLSIVLFGASDFGFRFFDYIVHILFIAIYYRALRHWLSVRAAILASLVFALYYASGQWGLAGQRDTYASLFLLCAVSLFLSIKNRFHRVNLYGLLCGICCAAAFLVRPTYIFFGLSFLILLWMRTKSARTLMFYLAGCFLPVAAFLIPYIFIPDGLRQVYNSIILFNIEVYSSVKVPIALWTNGRIPIYVFALIGILMSFRKASGEDRLFFVLLLLSAVLSPILMGKYFLYHFEPLVLIAIGFAAAGFDNMLRMISYQWIQTPIAILSLVLFAFFYYPRHLAKIFFKALAREKSPLEATYEACYAEAPPFALRSQLEVKNYVDHTVSQTDPVEYVSLFPSLRWRLARPEATKFTTFLPIAASTVSRNNAPEFVQAWRSEFLTVLGRAHPTFIITSKTQASWPFAGTTADSALHSIPGFDSILSARYSMDTVIQGFVLYRLRK